MTDRIKTFLAEAMTTGVALGIVVLALVLFCVWGLYSLLYGQTDERM